MEAIENLLAEMEQYAQENHVPIINEKGDRAYYFPARDEIHLPLREQFPKVAEYYSTAFHESVHSTGHEKRLNRLTKTAHFGNDFVPVFAFRCIGANCAGPDFCSGFFQFFLIAAGDPDLRSSLFQNFCDSFAVSGTAARD